MKSELLLNPITTKQLKYFLNAPSQGLILSGEIGSGKLSVGLHLAASLLKIEIARLQTSQYFMLVEPDPSVSIDQIRAIKKFLQLQTSGKNAIRRVILIKDAQTMTAEAQNAFLKVFEEPPADTVIILTCDNVQSLLPTISSRAPEINIRPASLDEALAFFAPKYGRDHVTKVYILSEGNAGLLASLLDAEQTHPLSDAIIQAKQILAAPVFTRLTQIEPLLKEKSKLPLLIEALYKIVHAALINAVKKGHDNELPRLNRSLATIHEAKAGLDRNISGKLVLTQLLINV